MKRVHAFLDKLNIPNWLAVTLFASLLLRIPSFFEPYYYGDEMIYLTLGQGIRQGIPLYSGLHDNKPPILYLIAGTAGSLVWFKVFLAIAGIISIILFSKIVKNLFEGNQKLQKIAVVIFALFTTTPLLEGNIANAENFMMVFSLGAIYILLAKKLNFKNLFFSGFLFGVSLLTKVPALFDLPVMIVFWLLTKELNKVNIKEIITKTLHILIGFSVPILITLAWFFFTGHISDYIKAAFLQNIGYVSSFRPGDIQKSFLVRNLPLLIRGFIVLMGTIILFVFRKKLSKEFILASVWTLFALFAATLSERPYPHYLLQVVAPMSILFGILFAQRSFEQSLTVVPLFIVFFVPAYYRFWLYPTFSYYTRFISFAAGKTTKEEYFAKFNKNVPRNYKIADFLVTSSYPTDKVFVWGPDSPTIYALSRRLPPIKYVADYHVIDYSSKKDIVSMLSSNKPRFIVMTPDSLPFSEINPLLKKDYLLIDNIDGADIWGLLSSKR